MLLLFCFVGKYLSLLQKLRVVKGFSDGRSIGGKLVICAEEKTREIGGPILKTCEEKRENWV